MVRRWRHRAVGPAAFVVMVIVASAAVAAAPDEPGAPPDRGRREFRIAGSVEGVVPVAVVPLVLSIDNPEAFAIRVESVEVTVADANPSCAADNLIISEVPTPIDVQRRGQEQVTLDATLRPEANDACQGATFALTYSATAARSDR